MGAGRRRWIVVVVLLAVAGAAGGVALALWPAEPEPAPAAEGGDDTGLTRDQTEDMMRSIGYVQ